ncbi:hypothetical protein BC939DRAFT_500631 [Gamsiella multidivaricata]|uniref:uncharacterized protein n=1 Tax=Gamsiella multidivaricata TaxID=101098 RepID=UPI00221F232E|nr:uncharacterized protein BC939DRAFT_500631 [Gamsiella multidivaricata]KAG0364409.1 hypothetical protein BGZ54_007546 [Gamsiella multidivaricata]KAI7828856.1 hypothetical protein BC939DRAFT_500631 [Gamsiella multidivaricata]
MSSLTQISTLAATLTSAVISATDSFVIPTTLASPTPTTYVIVSSSPTPSSPPHSAIGGAGPTNNMLCDWIRSASDCRDEVFIRYLLIASSVMHGIVFLFGLWLLIYRNRGFNSKIFTELFVKAGTGVRPKPMDCIVFFTSLASLIKIGVNVPLILDVLKDMLWLRIAIEQLYWIVVSVGFSSYFVGLLYAMPVTAREGIFAVYQPEASFDAHALQPIHVLKPTNIQKNFLLVMGVVYPTIFAAAPGVASAVFVHMPGYENLSNILLVVQYSNWVLILWTMAIMFFYYGLKYTFILRANIIIAEAALKAPRAAFGIGNLRSSSPARFLFIQLQITGFMGSAVTLLAGTLCMIWVLCREKILAMPNDQIPHTMAFFWTCAIAVAFFLIMVLIAIQSVRNRNRGLHGSTTSPTNSSQPSSVPGQKTPIGVKSLYSAQNHKSRSVRTDSEMYLTQHNSMEKGIYEKPSFDTSDESYDPTSVAVTIEASHRMESEEFTASHNAYQMEQERVKKGNAGLSTRSCAIMAQNTCSDAEFGRRGSDAISPDSTKMYPDLLQTVFGPTRSISPPPFYPTPPSPSLPLMPLRSSPRSPNHKHDPSEERSKHVSNRQRSLHASSQVFQDPSSHAASSGSHTLCTGLTREPRYTAISESYTASIADYGGRNPLNLNRDGEGEYRFPSEQQQPQQQVPFQTLQYQISCKGLSPPPRAKRLASSPYVAEDMVVAPLSPIDLHSPGPLRNTFMNTTPLTEYSDTSRTERGYSSQIHQGC